MITQDHLLAQAKLAQRRLLDLRLRVASPWQRRSLRRKLRRSIRHPTEDTPLVKEIPIKAPASSVARIRRIRSLTARKSRTVGLFSTHVRTKSLSGHKLGFRRSVQKKRRRGLLVSPRNLPELARFNSPTKMFVKSDFLIIVALSSLVLSSCDTPVGQGGHGSCSRRGHRRRGRRVNRRSGRGGSSCTLPSAAGRLPVRPIQRQAGVVL